MAKTLKLTNCRVDPKSIMVSFSEPVDMTAYTGPGTALTSALNPTNYTISAQGSTPAAPNSVVRIGDRDAALIPVSAFSVIPGEWVTVAAMNIAASDPTVDSIPAPPGESLSRQVPSDAARATRDAEDAVAYPVLTEEVSFRPSPVGPPVGGGGGASAGGGSGLGQVAMRAVSDVLGWKPSTTDPKGFLGALTQSFNLTDVEGHVESKWVPRTYAVQTDLGGGITGAQASLYTRAKDALDQSLLLLDGLYPLDPEADPEYVKALREMARSQMTEIVKEFGAAGLPSILRIDTYWEILLGQHPSHHKNVEFDPDKIKGTLGELRNTYGIKFRGNKFNNSIEDEQDITNFRMISDYMTSLMQSWIDNREFFIVAPNRLAFFGTQLVLISRQLNVIAETVNEVRFTLDSVFIGPNERQTLLLEFKDRSLTPMFLEDVLVEIERFVTDEGPRLLRDGGKISVTNNILPVVRSLKHMIEQAHDPVNRTKIPDGFRTARVRRSLDDLQDQLRDLIQLTEQVEQQVPPAEDTLSIDSVALSPYQPKENEVTICVYGSAFDPSVEMEIHSPTASRIIDQQFVSAERIDLTFSPSDVGVGSHDIHVTNSDHETFTLHNAFSISKDSSGKYVVTVPTKRRSGGGGAGLAMANSGRPVKNREVVIETGSGNASPAPVVASQPAAPTGSQPPVTPPAEATAAQSAPAASPAASAADVAALNGRIDQLQASHQSLAQEVRAELGKIVEFMKGKSGS
jgi:hypothetical protein